jgi:CubicO group peptidase (beta-lactamase class C family)
MSHAPYHKPLGIFLALLALLVGCAQSAPAPPSPTPAPAAAEPAPLSLEAALVQFDGELGQLQRDLRIPGMSVALLHQQEVVYARGFGYADLENRVLATAHTPYYIASLTKPMTAVLLLRMVEAGQLDLDANLADYMPNDSYCAASRSWVRDYRCYSEAITVRQHMTHTAHATPGEQFFYNGVLYALLGQVVEQVAARDFATVLIEELFTPLQMNRTSFGTDTSYHPGVLTELARPYQVNRAGDIIASTGPGPRLNASEGVISTVLDLARFDQALDNNEILSAETKALMFTPATSGSGQVLPYGLGWFVQDVEGERLIWHYGWQPVAYSALLLKVPERELTFILLANSDAASAGLGEGPGFGLEYGDVRGSPFATSFLDLFLSAEL